MTTLSPEAVEQFARDGFLAPLPAIPAEEMAGYRARLEAQEAVLGGPLQGNFRHKVSLLFTWADELVHDSRILDAVEQLLGPDILCWSTSFFTKEPDKRAFISWHQDSTYWGLEPHDVVTAWVAFTRSDRISGCMRVIPGSHHAAQLPHVDTFHSDNLLSRGQEIAVDVDEAQAVDLLLQPGQMSLHHIKLVHGSSPNCSDDRRIGLAIRYLPTHVRQVKTRDSAILVRGQDRYGNFDPEPRPQRDLDAAARAAHAEATGRQIKALYQGTDKTAFRA